MDLSTIYSDLNEEQREEIEALPRAERLIHIATLLNRPTRELVTQIAATTGLPVSKEIELIDNPTATLPLRLIHEYQCVPVRSTEQAAADETDEPTSAGPIPLVTLWPPDEAMDRWIFAVSGRMPAWHLGDPEQVINTITQRFGVGADSLEESDVLTNEAEADEGDEEAGGAQADEEASDEEADAEADAEADEEACLSD